MKTLSGLYQDSIQAPGGSEEEWGGTCGKRSSP
jgi:hypothetical protein